MKRMSSVFREMLANPGIIHMPIAHDPLTARIAERVGFRAVNIGGYAFAASICIPEPFLSLEDLVSGARRIATAVSIPVTVDAGAGYGDPAHVVRTVREFERAGVAAIRIEDQVFPKRAHYHKGIEHLISAEIMCEKIRTALRARRDPEFVIGARTDAMRTDGYAEGIRRANLYLEAGAEFVLVFPNSVEEAQSAPREIKGLTAYVNSDGNRISRPIFSRQQLEAMGYKIGYESISAINTVAKATKDLFVRLKETGATGMEQAMSIPVRKEIEDTIGLDEYYQIEEATVERTG